MMMDPALPGPGWLSRKFLIPDFKFELNIIFTFTNARVRGTKLPCLGARECLTQNQHQSLLIWTKMPQYDSLPYFQDDASSTQRLEGVTSSKLTKVSKVSPDGSSKVSICNTIYNHKSNVGLFALCLCPSDNLVFVQRLSLLLPFSRFFSRGWSHCPSQTRRVWSTAARPALGLAPTTTALTATSTPSTGGTRPSPGPTRTGTRWVFLDEKTSKDKPKLHVLRIN